MKKFTKNKILATLAIVFVLGSVGFIIAKAATTVPLGTTDSFAVLAGSTITNTGSSVVNGDLGLSPGTSITGFPPGTLSGIEYVNNAVALQAKNDLTTAYNSAASQVCDTDLTGQDLGGLTLTPGTYCFNASAGLTGTLTLDALGNPNAVFLFKIGTTLTTASNSIVSIINSGQSCNVFWQVSTSATLGTGTDFYGNILALTSVTLNTSANVNGRVLAQNGAVTLDTNNITRATCAGVLPGTLHVVNTLVNDNGGTLSKENFSFSVNGGSAIAFKPGGQNDLTLSAGTYTITEPAIVGYTSSYNNCSNLVIPGGGSATCIITNDDVAPSLYLRKTVSNNYSGTAVNTAWTLTATGILSLPTNLTGTTPVDSGATFKADTYTLAESGGPSLYTASAWSCVKNGGAPVTGASVALGLGDTATCTIINSDVSVPIVVLPVSRGGGNGGMLINSNVIPTTNTTTVVSPIASPVIVGGTILPVAYTASTPIPSFPDTGFPPKNNNTINIILISGIFVFTTLLLAVVTKKITKKI